MKFLLIFRKIQRRIYQKSQSIKKFFDFFGNHIFWTIQKIKNKLNKKLFQKFYSENEKNVFGHLNVD